MYKYLVGVIAGMQLTYELQMFAYLQCVRVTLSAAVDKVAKSHLPCVSKKLSGTSRYIPANSV